MFKIRYYFIAIFILIDGNTSVALAEEVKLSHKGLSLNANLVLAENKKLKDGVVVMTHATLAHNKMESAVALRNRQPAYRELTQMSPCSIMHSTSLVM
jgi:hypothetical protein